MAELAAGGSRQMDLRCVAMRVCTGVSGCRSGWLYGDGSRCDHQDKTKTELLIYKLVCKFLQILVISGYELYGLDGLMSQESCVWYNFADLNDSIEYNCYFSESRFQYII